MSLGDAILRSRFDPDVRHFRWLLGLFVMWIFLGVQSCTEIRYAISGETATAQVIDRSTAVERGQRGWHKYRWTDSRTGQLRQATLEAGPDEIGETLDIVYLPGVEGLSMPASRRSWLMPSIFLGSTLAVIAALIVLSIRLRQPPQRRPLPRPQTHRRAL